MRFLVVSESPADEAAIKIIVTSLVGDDAEFVSDPLRYRSGGWNAVLQGITIILRAVYFRRLADVIVFVVDSDFSTPHQASHQLPPDAESDCRYCLATHAINCEELLIRQRTNFRLNVAFGLAVPAIEAWLLFGINRQVGEDQWVSRLKEDKPLFTVNDLKQELYGSTTPGREIQTRKMEDEARRVCTNLTELQKWFPHGFGPLADKLRQLAGN